MDYSEFIRNKEIRDIPTGFDVPLKDLASHLFDWQKVVVRWGLRRGRAAFFEGTGLGKTIQQLEWGKWVCAETKQPVLLVAPLAVSEQTFREASKFGMPDLCKIVREAPEVQKGKINITNYERLHKFDPSVFSGVILDESSILKSIAGATRNRIIEMFASTPFRLSCTATPSPNDYIELGNQSQFLGILTESEMKSTFFVNDSGDTGTWRLRGHVKDNIFWKWMASWAAVVTKPSDIGFSDEGFELPELRYHEHIIPASTTARKRGFFIQNVTDLNDRRRVRKETVEIRSKTAAEVINATDDIWIIWCNLNDESKTMTSLVDHAVEVAGEHDSETKTQRMLDFSEGKIKRLVTKPKIAGWGMNWQVCNKVAFIGLNDSWESLFQAIRRVWRFGQTQPVDVHIFIEEREGTVLKNLNRKDMQYQEMVKSITNNMADLVKKEVTASSKNWDSYNASIKMELPQWL